MSIENDNRFGPNADGLRYNDGGEDQSMTSGIDFAQAPMQLSLAEGVAVNGALGASLEELTGISASQLFTLDEAGNRTGMSGETAPTRKSGPVTGDPPDQPLPGELPLPAWPPVEIPPEQPPCICRLFCVHRTISLPLELPCTIPIWSELDEGPPQEDCFTYERDQPTVKFEPLVGKLRVGISNEVIDWMVKTDGPWIELARLNPRNLNKRIEKLSKAFGGRDECDLEVPFDIVPTAKARQKLIHGDLASVTQTVQAYLNGALCATMPVTIVYKDCDIEETRARAQELQVAAPPPDASAGIGQSTGVDNAALLGTDDNPTPADAVASVNMTLTLEVITDTVQLYPDCCCEFYRCGLAFLRLDLHHLKSAFGGEMQAWKLAAYIKTFFEGDDELSLALKDILTKGLPECFTSPTCTPNPQHVVREYDLGRLFVDVQGSALPLQGESQHTGLATPVDATGKEQKSCSLAVWTESPKHDDSLALDKLGLPLDYMHISRGDQFALRIKEKLAELGCSCISSLVVAGHGGSGLGPAADGTNTFFARKLPLADKQYLRSIMCQDATVEIRKCESFDNDLEMDLVTVLLGGAHYAFGGKGWEGDCWASFGLQSPQAHKLTYIVPNGVGFHYMELREVYELNKTLNTCHADHGDDPTSLERCIQDAYSLYYDKVRKIREFLSED